jgi:hypothetical protein
MRFLLQSRKGEGKIDPTHCWPIGKCGKRKPEPGTSWGGHHNAAPPSLWKTKRVLAERTDGEYATRLPCKSRMKGALAF